MRRFRARRGLDHATRRQLTRYQNLLILIGVVGLAAAAAVLVAWLLAHLLNGAIAA
jgi:hypothetical protein